MYRTVDERLLLTSLKFVKRKQYWEEKLSGSGDVDGLRIFHVDSGKEEPGNRGAAKTVEIPVPAETCAGVMKLSNESPLTIYIILLAALKTLLHRYSGTEDVVVWSPVYEPNVTEETLNNRLAIREHVSDDKSFKELLVQLSGTVREAYENQDYPFDEILNSLSNNKNNTNRENGGRSISETACVLENIHNPGKIDDIKPIGPLVFSFRFSQEKKNIKGVVKFDAAVYEIFYIEQLSRHYANLLAALVGDVARKIGDVDFLADQEKQQLIYEFNDTETGKPADRELHQVFEEQAAKTPDSMAVQIAENGAAGLTYRQLNEKANRLAHFLRGRGVGPGGSVALMLERSIELVIGLYAVLKAGGTYVPIDPTYPQQRIAYMLDSSAASLILTQGGGRRPQPISGGETISSRKRTPTKKQGFFGAVVQGEGDLPSVEREYISLSSVEEELAEQPADNPEPAGSADDLMYVIFTSGSTGEPKGAAVYRRGFSNLMEWFINDFSLAAGDSNLLITSMSFDLTQKNLYAPLLTGGTLVLPTAPFFDPRAFLQDIAERQVTWINCTPGMFSRLVEEEITGSGKRLGSLRYVFLGGEPIAVSPLLPWLESEECQAVIVNTYGPTECTDICASYRVEEPRRYLSRPVPIGSPIYNVELYILDNNLQLLPIGVPGELFIGGAGVGSGYINDEKLTGEKFVNRANGFNRSYKPYKPYSPGRLYRTGDQCRWLPDGNIEFFGRIDQQVKVRGFRIELGEVENRLLSHHSIKEAVVTVREDKRGEKYLCAYISPRRGGAAHPPSKPLRGKSVVKEQNPASGDRPNAGDLRAYLAQAVPDHMVPAHFVFLDAFPLSPNGKVDRRALPEPEESGPEQSYAAPETRLEKVIAQTWKEVLKLEKVGVNDNFFQIGGNSLEIARLLEQMKKALGRDLEFVVLFQYPTIRELARFLAAEEEGGGSEAPAESVRTEEIKAGKNRLKRRIHKNK